MKKYYGLKLSLIHDEGFSQHAINSFSFILKEISKNHKTGLIVELGCGSGIMLKN